MQNRWKRGASLALFAILLLHSTLTAFADTSYDETSDGDLSGDGLAPTLILLTPGVNSLTATSVAGDVEYVHITVPAGLQLNELVLTAYDSTDPVAFAAVQRGTTFTEPTTGTDVANLLGYAHFGPGQGDLNTDILDNLGTGAGAIGFTAPLASSDYTFWIQQTGAAATTYTLNFMVGPASSQVRHDEGSDGDLSGDGSAPTAITLESGGNSVTATSVAGDVEYIAVTVPENHKLDALLLTAYASTDEVIFAALQRGDAFTEPTTGTDVANLLGYAHAGPGRQPLGADILDDMAAGQGAIGFTPSLGSDTYTFWLQQTGSAETTYTVDFVVSAMSPTHIDDSPESEFIFLYMPAIGR